MSWKEFGQPRRAQGICIAYFEGLDGCEDGNGGAKDHEGDVSELL